MGSQNLVFVFRIPLQKWALGSVIPGTLQRLMCGMSSRNLAQYFLAINVQNVLSPEGGAHRGIRNCKQRREKKPAAQKPSLASNITLRARFPFNAALQMRLGFRRGCNPNPIVLDQGLGNLGRKLDNRLQR